MSRVFSGVTPMSTGSACLPEFRSAISDRSAPPERHCATSKGMCAYIIAMIAQRQAPSFDRSRIHDAARAGCHNAGDADRRAGHCLASAALLSQNLASTKFR